MQRAESLAALFFSFTSENPKTVCFGQAEYRETGKRPWRYEDNQNVLGKVCRVADHLRSLGVKKGDRIAIASYSRPEWMIADLAILSLGAVSVSIYHSVNRDETGYILFDSEAQIIFAENIEQLDKLRSLASTPCPIPATENRAATSTTISVKHIICFEEVPAAADVTQWKDILNRPTTSIPSEVTAVQPSDIASLVYTSGTTGPPKGVIQTHANHLANIRQAILTEVFDLARDLFLFLPLAHSFARLVGYLGFLTPTVVKFAAIVDKKSSVLNPASVLQDLREASCYCVPTVPRILEKMSAGVKAKALEGGIGGALVGATLASAKAVFNAKRDNVSAPIHFRLLFLLTTPLRKKIKRKLFGPTFGHVVSGGAKLPVPINEFFTSLGITIYEGYGLTETCVATNVNLKHKNKIGSVGPCLADIQIKFADDGEILFKGPNVTQGYLNRPEATRAAWDAEGWFHTGDIGHLDDDGYLFITGRKKEIIVTAGGKKIAPAAIEEKLSASRYISSSVVLGDGKPYCVALIVPDRETLREWLRREGLAEDFQHPKVIALYQGEIDKLNSKLSKFETIKHFAIIPDELTVENGMLTPTFKVKRGLIEKRYGDLISKLYE